ncbi:unnamed protein product [Polarella glacialis]|uniref:Uncharacterized protein n=1 Tax=Polarella glacialis TaxID=89957 RepID=A0A813D871_POLGL|nr:unnamed protein product [Polarella glacialis]CAE8721780.1 unnamed protein product [Polarella glacialis]
MALGLVSDDVLRWNSEWNFADDGQEGYCHGSYGCQEVVDDVPTACGLLNKWVPVAATFSTVCQFPDRLNPRAPAFVPGVGCTGALRAAVAAMLGEHELPSGKNALRTVRQFEAIAAAVIQQQWRYWRWFRGMTTQRAGCAGCDLSFEPKEWGLQSNGIISPNVWAATALDHRGAPPQRHLPRHRSLSRFKSRGEEEPEAWWQGHWPSSHASSPSSAAHRARSAPSRKASGNSNAGDWWRVCQHALLRSGPELDSEVLGDLSKGWALRQIGKVRALANGILRLPVEAGGLRGWATLSAEAQGGPVLLEALVGRTATSTRPPWSKWGTALQEVHGAKCGAHETSYGRGAKPTVDASGANKPTSTSRSTLRGRWVPVPASKGNEAWIPRSPTP